MDKPSQPAVADLWYQDEPAKHPPRRIPAWASFIAHLGASLAGSDAAPTTVALSVPVRDFVAVLAATAAVIRRDQIAPMAPDDLTSHIATLRETPIGAPIKYLAPKDKVHDGRWQGFEISPFDRTERLCFELRRKETRKLAVTQALNIRLTGETQANGQLQARTISTPPLLRAVRGESAAVTFVTTYRCDVMLVGTLSVLEAEMTQERFYADGVIDSPSGVLQDLARVQQYRDAKRFYRCVTLASASEAARAQMEAKPCLVVYDGARAFLRYRHLWALSHRLVVLDRSAASSEDAADELAQDYAYSQGDSPLLQRFVIPAGFEAVAYEGAQ